MATQELLINRKRAIKTLLKRAYNILLDEIEDIVEDELNPNRQKMRKGTNTEKKTGTRDDIYYPYLQDLSSGTEYIAEYGMLLRMTPDIFDRLLALIAPKIQKQDTLLRDAIPSRVMLEVTLNFLATGSSFHTLQCCFRVSKAAISNFVPKVCDAITESLKDFIDEPVNEFQWQTIADGYCNIWNFPGCCGAVDGKHILINMPNPECYHYRGSNSVVLIIVVNHRYCITHFEVCKKSPTNTNLLQNCQLLDRLEEGLLPAENFFVADEAFPLKTYLMKPYCHANNKPLTQEQKIFNYRLSRARKTVENVFGILLSRFRALDRRLSIKLDTVNKLVSAACALHNWFTLTANESYMFKGAVDEQNCETGEIVRGRWRSEIMELRNLAKCEEQLRADAASDRRDKLKKYFSAEGALPWQIKAMNETRTG